GFTDMAHTVIQTITNTLANPTVHAAIPYIIAAGVILLGKPLARLARRVVDKIADKAGWDAGTRLLARHAAGWASWIAAAIISSQFAGVEPITVAKSFGITTLAMSLALKGFLGNLIQGGALLLSHPFDIGDKIKLGKTEYKVLSMNLREVILTKDDGATHTHLAYSVLSEMPITIYRPYVTGKSFLELRRPDLKPPSIPRNKNWFRMAGYAALGLGVVFPGAAFVHPWLLKTIPWLYAIGVGVGTFFLARYAPKVIDRIAKARQWGANEQMIGRMAASAGVFLLGLATALRILGASWEALAASAGVTGIIVTIAATEIIQSTIASFTLLGAQPFTIGDRIKVGDDHEGTVVDITLRYVVIKNDGAPESFTILPVGLFSKFEAPGDAGRRGKQAK
ncbi:MAG: mechanosensitive ion channel, partial [Elusimicrobia bacterium]|nr:mechanosensitive ion channel [Elusimicrobiota bacterium]